MNFAAGNTFEFGQPLVGPLGKLGLACPETGDGIAVGGIEFTLHGLE
jgi:hypothetical protein